MESTVRTDPKCCNPPSEFLPLKSLKDFFSIFRCCISRGGGEGLLKFGLKWAGIIGSLTAIFYKKRSLAFIFFIGLFIFTGLYSFAGLFILTGLSMFTGLIFLLAFIIFTGRYIFTGLNIFYWPLYFSLAFF